MLSLNQDFSDLLVQALIHSLWIAILPFGLLLIANRVFQAKSPNLRYWCGVGCLVAFSLSVPITMIVLQRNDSSQSDSISAVSLPATTSSPSLASANSIKSLNLEAAQPGLSSGPNGNVVISELAEAPVESSDKISFSSLLHALSPWCATLYFIGVVLFFARMLLGVFITRRFRRNSQIVDQSELIAAMKRAKRQAGLVIAPTVRWCNEIAVPTVVGIVSPIVLLPLRCASGMSTEQLEQILIHEFTHLKRFDHLVNLLQNTIEAVLFFHPLVWIVSRQVRLDRELCCDTAVVAAGRKPSDYADSLLKVAALGRHSFGTSAIAGVAAVSGQSQLRTRIESLMGHSPQRSHFLNGGSSVAIAGLLAICLIVSTQLSATPLEPQESQVAEVQAEEEVASDDQAIGQNQESTVKELIGTIQDTNGNPLADVLVEVWRQEKGNQVQTNAEGRFQLPQHEDWEDFRVRITKTGFSPHFIIRQAYDSPELTITLDNRTYIEGVVLDPDGQPVSGEIVQGQRVLRGLIDTFNQTTAKTNAEGKYRLYVSPQTNHVEIKVSSVGVRCVDDVEVTENEAITLDIQLQLTVRFEAKVVDAQSGEPVEGVVLWDMSDPEQVGISNAQGEIVIDDMTPGLNDFGVGQGEPIQRSRRTTYGWGSLGRWWSQQATKKEQRLVRAGVSKSLFNFDSLQFDLSNEMESITVIVEQGVVFSGHVYDPNGNPVAGATVSPVLTKSLGMGGGPLAVADRRYGSLTAADGSFRTILPASHDIEYNLLAHDGPAGESRNWANGVTKTIKSSPGAQYNDFDITLCQPATIRGKVVADEGAPIGQFSIYATSQDGYEDTWYQPFTRGNEDGTFEIKYIRPGKYSLQFAPQEPAGQEPAGQDLQIPPFELELKADEVREGIQLIATSKALELTDEEIQSRTLKVHVVDASGKPVPNQKIYFHSQERYDSTPAIRGDREGLVDRWREQEVRADIKETDNSGTLEFPSRDLFNFSYSGPPYQSFFLLAYDVENAVGAMGVLISNASSPELTLTMEPLVDVTLTLDDSLIPEAVGRSSISIGSSPGLDVYGSIEQGELRIQLPPGEYGVVLENPLVQFEYLPFMIESGEPTASPSVLLQPNELAQLIGKPTPELQNVVAWHGGDAITLEKLRGKVVIVHLWRYQYEPSVSPLAELIKIHDQYRPEDVVILAVHWDSGVTMDELLAGIEPMKATHWNNRELPFRIAQIGEENWKYADDAGLFTPARLGYKHVYLPTTVLIDQNGVIVSSLSQDDADAMAVKIDQLLE